jgi:purine-cytosine permease-like protein
MLQFSILGNLAATMYSITLNFQLLLPSLLLRIPRLLYALLTTAIIIPVAIYAAKSFFVNLENFIGVIGYWSAAFIGVVLVEHVVFRARRFGGYTEEGAWQDGKRLPVGFAAIASAVLCFGLVVPGMGQIWFTGPVAERTGDIGFEVAFVVAAVLYLPLRWLERKKFGR